MVTSKLKVKPVSVGAEPSPENDENSFLPDQISVDSIPAVPGPAVPANTQTDELQLPDQVSHLENVYNSVAPADPDRAAKVISISQKIKEPENFVDKNLDHIDRTLSAPDGSFFSQLEKQYPETAKYLSDPKKMAVAKDDLPNTANHEQLVNQVREAHSFWDAIQAGYQSSATGLTVRQRLPDVKMPADAPMAESLASDVAGFAGDFPAMFVGGGLGFAAGGAAGSAVPIVGNAIGAGVGADVGAFALPAMYKTYLTEQYEKGSPASFDDFLDRTSKVLKEGGKEGLVGLLTFGTGKVGKTLGKGTAKLLEKQGLIQGEKIFAKGINPGKAIETFGEEAGKLVGMTGGGAAVNGGDLTTQSLVENALLLGVLHGATESRRLVSDKIAGRKAIDSKEFYTSLGETAEASKLRERMPEAHKELVDNITKDGPVENIYIPVEAAEQYFQSKNIPTEDAMKELGADKQYAEAKLTGGDVKIPLSEWVDKVVGTEHYQALADDIKFNPEDMTVREVNERQAEIQKELAATESKAKDAQAESEALTSDQEPKQGSKIQDMISQQLKDAGLSPTEVKFDPKLQEAFFNTLSKHLGVTPEALFEKYPLSILKSDGEFVDSKASKEMVAQSGNGLEQGPKKSVDQNIANNATHDKINYDRTTATPTESEQLRAKLADTEKLLGEERRLRRTNEVSGLRNKIAFDEDASLGWPAVGAMDMDGLKRINDHLGHEAGDQVIKALGDALLKAEDSDNVRFYHRSGDEFMARFKDPAQADAFMADLQKKLEKVGVEISINGVPKWLYRGIGLSFGTGEKYETADKKANDQKEERLKAGLREDRRVPGPSKRLVPLAEHTARFKSDGTTGGSDGRGSEGSGPTSLEQGPRGRIVFGTDGSNRSFNVELLKNADKSTFLHETGHYFLEVMHDIATSENAPQELKDDYKTIRDWLGAKEGEKLTKDQHEQFARGFEAYLMEGKAPSTSLQRAFNKFKDWLLNIYQSMKGLNVELTDEVRGVMDRMLASRDEINEAAKVVGYNAEDVHNLAPEVQKKIGDLQLKARELAEHSLLKEQMKEVTSQHKEFLASERTKITAQAEKEVNELPLFKAAKDLEGFKSKNGVSKLAEKFLAGKASDDDSSKIIAIAEDHGFVDANDLAKQLLSRQETFAKEMKARIDAGMAKHADLKDTAAIKAEALKAIHNEKMTDLLALEREILNDLIHNAEVKNEVSKRKRIEASVEANAARESAKALLSAKSIRDASNARLYITAERNAAVKVAKAIAKKDFESATKYKREQMLNHALVSESLKIKEEAAKSVDFISKYAARDNDMMKMPYGFIRQVDSILSKFGFADPRDEDSKTLVQTAKDMLEKGEDPSDITNATGFKQDQNGNWVPENLSDFQARVNDNYYGISLPDSVLLDGKKEYKELTLQELRDVKDSVKAIADIGKKFNRFLDEYKTMDIREAAKALEKKIKENIGQPYSEKMKIGSQYGSGFKDKLSAVLNLPDAVIPDMVNVLTLTQYLDGGKVDGLAKEYIYRPLKEAEDRKFARYEKMTKAVNDLISKHYEPKEFSKLKEQRIKFESLGRFLTKEEVLSLALNWGNEGNRDRIRKGYNLTDDQVKTVLDTLDKRDWDLVQDIWHHLDSYWPEISALEKKIRGFEPSKVENAKVDTRFGTYDGGYYPIVYDFEKSSDAYKSAEQKNALYKQFSATAAHTDRGHAERRVTTVSRPVRLSMDVLFNHLENVVHDLEYRPAVIDVNRFLNQREVKSSISNAIGVKGFKSIGDWLKAMASDQGEFLNLADKAFRWFRFNTTFATLSYRLINFPMDIVGNISNGVWEIGPTRMAGAIKDFVMSPLETKAFVDSKSERMKHRATLRDRDILDMSKKWMGKDSHFKQFGFYLQSLADEAVSYPLWAEVYKKNVSQYGEVRAKHIADETIARTVGSGSVLDQVGAQRGPESKKILSMFYSYMSMMFNRCWLDGKMAGLQYNRGNLGAAIAIMAKATFFAWAMQSLNENFWREIAHNSDNDDEDARTRRVVSRTLQQPFGYIWVARDISGYLIDSSLGTKNVNYRVSPMEQAVENILKPMGEGIHALTSDQEASDKFAEDSARSASYLFGYPQQFNNLTFNFLDWSQDKGELTWRDLLSRKSKH